MSEAAATSVENPAENWSKVLDHAEKAGQENMKFHIDNGDCLAKDSNSTLTILLAGGGATLGYWMKLLEQGNHPHLVWGVGALSCYLFALALLLLIFGMQAEDLEAPTNEPQNLMVQGFAADLIREEDLKDLQRRIDLNIARNERKAFWLNWARRLLVFAPVVFVLGLEAGQLIVR